MKFRKMVIAAAVLLIAAMCFPVFAESDISESIENLQEESGVNMEIVQDESEAAEEAAEDVTEETLPEETEIDELDNSHDLDDSADLAEESEVQEDKMPETDKAERINEKTDVYDPEDDIDLMGSGEIPSYRAVFEGVWDESSNSTTWEDEL